MLSVDLGSGELLVAYHCSVLTGVCEVNTHRVYWCRDAHQGKC
jgi:hypothetical protein